MKNNILLISFIIILLFQNLTIIIGQNYVPLLKNNHKYSIYNINDSRLETPNEEYDLARATTTELFILLEKYNNSGFKCGLLETYNGKLFLPVIYDEIKIRDGYIWAESNKIEKEFIDLTIFDFKGNQILYEKNTKKGYDLFYDKDFIGKLNAGKIISTKNGVKVFDKDFKFLFSNNQLERINHLGDNLFTYSYTDINSQRPSLYGIMDRNGKILTKPNYSGLYLNDNGLISATILLPNTSTLEKCGFIDLKLKVVIPFKYAEFSSFENGGAIVSMVGYPYRQQYVINKNGDVLINKIFDKSIGDFLKIESYKFERAVVSKVGCEECRIPEKYLFNLVDKTGKLIFKKFYKKIELLNQNTFLVLDNDGIFKIINSSDKIIYKFINKFKYDYVIIDEGKNLLTYKYINSKIWETTDFQGKPIKYLNLSSEYEIDGIINNIIVAFKFKNSGFRQYFDLNGNKINKVTNDSFKEESFLTSDERFQYPYKINNKFIVYSTEFKSLLDSSIKKDYIWYDFRLDIEYSESNKKLFISN